MLSPAVLGRQRPAVSQWCVCGAPAALRIGLRGDGVFVSVRRRQSIGWHAAALLALVACVLASGGDGVVAIVRRAAAIPDKAEGLEGFVAAADALIGPALVAMAAVAPLGCLVGAGGVVVGSRRGVGGIGASVGPLVFLWGGQGI